MSHCDICTEPGHCCKSFLLNVTVAKRNWKKQFTKEVIEENGWGFLRIQHPVYIEGDPPGTVRVSTSCDNLTPEGLCGDYENRPDFCRVFEPLSSTLCIMTPKVDVVHFIKRDTKELEVERVRL